MSVHLTEGPEPTDTTSLMSHNPSNPGSPTSKSQKNVFDAPDDPQSIEEAKAPNGQPILSHTRGRRLNLSLKFLVPTIIVFVGSAGMATLLLVWLLIHNTAKGRIWKEKAFFLDEGTKLEGDQEAARLLGLTITSAAVRLTHKLNAINPRPIHISSLKLSASSPRFL